MGTILKVKPWPPDGTYELLVQPDEAWISPNLPTWWSSAAVIKKP
jgi:hypothetical protein